MSEQIKIDKCTSCGSDRIVVAGNKFLCRPCNIVYEVTDTGTKVIETDPLSEHEQRLANAVRDIAALKKAVRGGDEPIDPVEQLIDEETAGLNELPSEDEIDTETEEDGFIIFE